MKRRPPASDSSAATGPQRQAAGGTRSRARRGANRRKPDYLAPVRFVVLLLLVGQSLRVAFTSPRLLLEKVEVRGSQRLTPEQARIIGQVPIGQNIFSANLAVVADRLKQDPIVKELRVTRYLPNTLTVTVKDREPAIQLVTRNGRYLADAEGIVYRKVAAAAAPQTLPQIGIPLRLLPEMGKPLGKRTLLTIRQCVELSRKEQLKMGYVRIDSSGEVWLNVATEPTTRLASDGTPLALPANAGNLKVRLGRPTEMAEKFRDIRQTLAALPNLALTAVHLDVMCAGRPSYRPKPTPEASQAEGENRPVNPETASSR